VLTGAIPDEAARVMLVDGVRNALPGALVDDQIVVGKPSNPGAQSDKAERLGEVIKAVQVASPITFVPDTAELSPQSVVTVMLIAELLRDEEWISIQIDGHAARTRGMPDRALEVSEQRALVVRDALLAAGVNQAGTAARGLSDAHPLATLEASRRVEGSVRSSG